MNRHRCLKIAMWLGLILVVAACRASPPTAAPVSSLPISTWQPSFQPTSPPLEESSSYWPAETWRTSTPEQQGLDSARLEVGYDRGPVEWTIGLDDLYRFTSFDEDNGYGPGSMAAKGTWTNEKTFRLDFMEAGYTGNFYFIFEGTGVKVHFQGPWEAETFAGTLQEQ